MLAQRAAKADDGSELTMSEEVNPWMMANLKESHHQARREDEAVKIGDLEKKSEAIKVGPSSTRRYSRARSSENVWAT